MVDNRTNVPPTHKPIYLVVGIVFSLLATVAFFHLREKSYALGARQAAGSPSYTSDADAGRLSGMSDTGHKVQTSSKARQTYVEFAQSKTAMSALDSLSKLDDERRHDQIEARFYIEGICGPFTSGQYLKGKNTWLDRQLPKFCDGYHDAEFGELDLDGREALMQQGTRSQIESILNESRSIEDQRKKAQEILLLSDSPLEVQAVLQAAGERGYLLDVIRENVSGDTSIHAREISSVLAELQYCGMTHGCGPGSIAAIRACIATDLCGDQMDYISQLRKLYPPIVFESALRAHGEIMSRRSR